MAYDISRTVVIATHPGHDTSIVVGPYRSQAQLDKVVAKLDRKGWNTEICQLFRAADVPVVN